MAASNLSTSMLAYLVPLLLALTAPPASQELRPMKLAEADLFGQTGLDEKRIRDAFTLHAGYTVSPENWEAVKRSFRDAVVKVVGKPATEIAMVGFDEHGDMMVFVGIPGPTVARQTYRTLKGTRTHLSAEARQLAKAFEDRFLPALQSGGGSEDDSKGYALFSDPQLHAIQLKIRAFALKHEPMLKQVLDGSTAVAERRIASEFLGYAKHSRAQINALLRATVDPDDDVRNNSVRALGVIIRSDRDAAKMIPPAPFVLMVRSGIWTDRNKGAMVLDELTKSRDPKLFKMIRSQAVPSLLEMAHWHNPPHAQTARMILGRVAGFSDKQLGEMIESGQFERIFKAFQK